MGTILRSCPSLLSAALLSGVQLWRADLFTFTLADGVTVYNWTSFDRDLINEGTTYSSRNPWLKRSKWNVTNTMAVQKLTVFLYALNQGNVVPGFGGAANIKTQIHNGLFKGAKFVLSRAFLTATDLAALPLTSASLGSIDGLFGGTVGGIKLDGVKAEITVKGLTNRLDQQFPRNRYQTSCNHGFCDPGCTLVKATFTQTFAVGSSPAPTSTFIPWASAPGTPSLYIGGTFTLTTGNGAGQERDIANATASGLTLTDPLLIVPAATDSFTAFQGCDKTENSGSGRSCTDRSNTGNFDGYPFVPPPNMAI